MYLTAVICIQDLFRIKQTMCRLVADILQETIQSRCTWYFYTDQGSQYTSRGSTNVFKQTE
jgi:hypothetical protein